MKPSARRITRWIVLITLAEFIAFLMVFAIFWLETAKVRQVDQIPGR